MIPPCVSPTAALREPAFDPLFAGDALFRRVLEAVARPGRIVPLGALQVSVPPPGLRPACALLLGALDRDVSFQVVGPGAGPVREYLRFNTTARRVGIEQADFVLVTGGGAGFELARLERAGAGSRQAGVTVVYAPTRLSPAPARDATTLWLRGPGAIDESRLTVVGLAADDFRPVAARGQLTPGVDVWLASADGEVAAIPRSTSWRVADGG